VRPAEPVPDLSAAILAKARGPVGQPFEWARYALLTVALPQLVLALPALLLGHATGASLLVAREMGSFDVALAVGLLVAAWQPARANGLLPFAAALAGTLMVTAALDVADGRVPVVGEAHHVLDVAGLVLLWLLTKSVNSGWQPPRLRLRSRPT
jgi:predicted anti-sigma-YlaC factor YlaD